MLNIIQNTIGAIRRVGESVVRAGLKMWLPFTKAEPLGEELITNVDFSTDGTLTSSSWTLGWASSDNDGTNISDGILNLINDDDSAFDGRAYATNGLNDYLYLGSGKKYAVTYTISENTDNASLNFYFGTYTGAQPNTVGTHTVFHTQSGGTLSFIVRNATNNTTIKFSSFSVQEYAQETPDISGNDNNAILKTGKCLTFTGNDSVDTSFPSSKTIKTIAFWIYPTHTSSAEAIFYGGGGTGGTREIRLAGSDSELESINENIVMDTYVDGVYRGVTYGGTPAQLELDQWQRVVLTSSTGFSVVNDTFNIGDGLYAADGRFKMSDLQIYGAEFTTDDIAYDYANPQKLVADNASSNVTLNDLHAWWHMSEGDGTIAYDSAPLLGKELIDQSKGFNDAEYWVTSGEAKVEDGYGKIISSTGAICSIENRGILSVGRTYQVTYTVFKNVIGNLGIYTLSDLTIPSSIGTHTYSFEAGISTFILKRIGGGGTEIWLSNISIKEVYNIDGETYDGSSLGATYDDAQERIPQLGMMNWSKGSNLIEYSEDFSNSYYDNAGVTLDSGYLAPDGTMSAYKLSADVSGSGAVNNLFSGIGSYYRSIWAKTTSGTGSLCLLTRYDSTGSVVTITNEWQRFTINSADSLPDYFYIVDFRGGNLDEVILWGAQLEDADSVSAYRRTNGTAVTDATLISCATDSQKDILGNAVRVKGSGFNLDGTGYAEVLDDNVFDVGVNEAFSICGWAKWNYLLQNTSSLNVIFSNGATVGSGNNFSISSRLLGDGSKVVNTFINGADINSTTNYTNGEWFYFAFTRQAGGGNNTCTLYTSKIDQNGNWVVTSEGTTGNNAGVSNSYPKLIGWDGLANDRKYHDLIDDIKFYDRELSSDEIEQNFNATKSGHNN
jgi:hypothetical protein